MAGKFKVCRGCGRMTITVSWSSLKTHEECKQRGKLSRAGNRSVLADQRVYFPGTVTDRVVRKWLENSPADNLGAMPGMVREIMDREEAAVKEDAKQGVIRWKSQEDREKVVAECIEAVMLIEPTLVRHVLPHEYECDYNFSTPLKVPDPRGGMIEILLIGKMDILVHNPNTDVWAIFDVKHTRDNSYWRKTAPQLTFYDLDVELEYGKPAVAAALFQPLATPMVKPIDIDENMRAQMLQRVTGMVRDIVLDELPPRADMTFCGRCDYKHACVKFAPVVNAKGQKTIAF